MRGFVRVRRCGGSDRRRDSGYYCMLRYRRMRRDGGGGIGDIERAELGQGVMCVHTQLRHSTRENHSEGNTCTHTHTHIKGKTSVKTSLASDRNL